MTSARIRREKETMKAMLAVYCRAHHRSQRTANLCPVCQVLLAYSHDRLNQCPLASNKPSCRLCPIHCYGHTQRQQVRKVMKYAGPRMLLYHPIAALCHIKDELVASSRRR